MQQRIKINAQTLIIYELAVVVITEITFVLVYVYSKLSLELHCTALYNNELIKIYCPILIFNGFSYVPFVHYKYKNKKKNHNTKLPVVVVLAFLIFIIIICRRKCNLRCSPLLLIAYTFRDIITPVIRGIVFWLVVSSLFCISMRKLNNHTNYFNKNRNMYYLSIVMF